MQKNYGHEKLRKITLKEKVPYNSSFWVINSENFAQTYSSGKNEYKKRGEGGNYRNAQYLPLSKCALNPDENNQLKNPIFTSYNCLKC